MSNNQEELVITRSGQPVARIVPIVEHETLLSWWAAEGRARIPTRSGPLPLPVKTSRSVDVADQLINDRENERW
jgi:antitoxin (DNA-binding transcriptional repressor) of toxin-antitoxin stability system